MRTALITVMLSALALFTRAQVQPGLHVAEPLTVLFGQDTTGGGVKAFWMPFKAAFRAGAIGTVNVANSGEPFFSDPENWDPDSVGIFSFAAGFGTKAKGDYSFAMGEEAEALGFRTISLGNQSKAIGSTSIAMGDQTMSIGQRSLATGDGTMAVGNYSTAMGRETIAQGRASMVIGQYNLPLDDSDLSADTARLFIIGNGTNNSSRSNALVVQKSGNVGIGANRPQEDLVIGQDLGDLVGTRLSIGDAASFSGINLGESSDDRGFIIWEHDGDLLKLGTRQSGTFYDYILALKEGKLGVGTNAPSQVLDVNGVSAFRDLVNIGPGTGSNELNLFDIGADNDVVVRAKTVGNAMEMIMGLNSSGGLFGTVTATDLRFRTSNTHRMSITPSGDVGINTTGPTAKLDVNGTTRLRSTLTADGISNLEGRINLGPGTGTNELNIFDIGANGDAVIRAQTTGGAKEVLWGVSPLGGILGTVTSDDLTFRTNNTTRMSITSSGDVGIGTTSPSEKLDVSGDFNVTGEVRRS
ncbi:MAG: hypothetical protein OEM26_06190, partial [Saprospiraceae bacterium]|nr:hypothetical protein [Saprospiraceae bacterium]